MIDGPTLRAIESRCRDEASKLRACISVYEAMLKERPKRAGVGIALFFARLRLQRVEQHGRRAYRRRMAMVI